MLFEPTFRATRLGNPDWVAGVERREGRAASPQHAPLGARFVRTSLHSTPATH